MPKTNRATPLRNKIAALNTNQHLKTEKINLLIKEILYNSLAQALCKIYQTHYHTIKIFWCICLTGTVLCCIYFTMVNFVYYFYFEVSSKFRIINEVPALFPKVTICNKNHFTTKFAFDNYDNFVAKNVEFNDTLKQKLGHSLEDILLFCQFSQMKCSSKDFLWSYHRFFGNCFTFNTGFNSTGHKIKLKESIRAGVDLGLSLVFYANYYENISNTFLGAHVKIGNNSKFDITDGINVATGFETNIAVDRVYRFSMPKPYSNCDFEDEQSYSSSSVLFNLIKNSSHQYDQQFCFELCYHQVLFKHFNCSGKFDISFLDAINCKNDDGIYVYIDRFSQMHIMDSLVKEKCIYLCPLECKSIDYKLTMSYSHLTGQGFFRDRLAQIRENKNIKSDFILRPLNAENARNSLVVLNVYFNTLSYTEITDSVNMSFTLLLANVASTFGLFLGINALSLFELIDVLIEIYFISREKSV